MKCNYCGAEVEKPYWVGPKNLNLHYCDYYCSALKFREKYPDVITSKAYWEEIQERWARKRETEPTEISEHENE